MAFLDNSGDIILDAVLTDTGRFRLAKGDGSFKIVKFALGDDENPTDIALSLDYQIKHLLVDEVQDVSDSQYQLLHRLTREWSAGDGHTLFLVGDPQQAIYGFRGAEVRFFLDTFTLPCECTNHRACSLRNVMKCQTAGNQKCLVFVTW